MNFRPLKLDKVEVIADVFYRDWRHLRFYHRDSYKRLHEAKPELKFDTIKKIEVKDFEIRKINFDDWSILNNVRDLRTKNLVLRDKLLHLIKKYD